LGHVPGAVPGRLPVTRGTWTSGRRQAPGGVTPVLGGIPSNTAPAVAAGAGARDPHPPPLGGWHGDDGRPLGGTHGGHTVHVAVVGGGSGSGDGRSSSGRPHGPYGEPPRTTTDDERGYRRRSVDGGGGGDTRRGDGGYGTPARGRGRWSETAGRAGDDRLGVGTVYARPPPRQWAGGGRPPPVGGGGRRGRARRRR